MKRLRLNFQKGEGGLAGSQFLGEGCWEGGSDFFFRDFAVLHK